MSQKKPSNEPNGKPASEALSSPAWRDRLDDIDHVLDSARIRRGLLPISHESVHSPSTATGSTPIARKQTSSREPEGSAAPRGGFLASCILLFGLMAFACGGVLLGWYTIERRAELWSLGWPIMLAGQACLVLGLLLHVERMRHNTRAASQRLEALDDQLDHLTHTTSLLGTANSTASSAFYAHLAHGASPHLLLNDLKGQLDLLAVRLSESGRFSGRE